MTEEELQNLIDSGKLSEIETKPIVPGAPAIPNVPQAPSPYYTGSLSPDFSNAAQFNKTGYQTSPVAVHPLMPVAPNARPNVNSASISSANTNQFLLDQSKNAAIAAIGTALPGTVSAGVTIQPATLNSVSDSSTRYAQNSSNLVYRPSENPLTAFDGGAFAAIDVDSFDMITTQKDTIALDGGSIGGLSFGTLYFVYYTDDTLQGGDVTYQAVTQKTGTLTEPGNFFVGSITTPASGGLQTSGNNDGGVGSQSGGTNVLGFQAPTQTVVGNGTVTNPVYAVDGSTTSACELKLTGDGSFNQAEISTGLAAGVTGAYSSLTVSVQFSVPTNSLTGSPANPVVSLLISDLTGVTYATQTINSGVTMGLTTLSANIPVGLNPALLTVAIEAISGAGPGPFASGGSLEVDVFNISTVAVQ